MKSNVILNLSVNHAAWMDMVDFDVYKTTEELKNLAFDYVADVASHELLAKSKTYMVNVCLSDDAEVHKLNKEFRGLDKPTNVLSFANIDDDDFYEILDVAEEVELGDIILAFETLQREADIKNISVYAHYCHLVVHGFLHVLGFDHQEDDEAEEMENLETEILALFSIDDPYREEEGDALS